MLVFFSASILHALFHSVEALCLPAVIFDLIDFERNRERREIELVGLTQRRRRRRRLGGLWQRKREIKRLTEARSEQCAHSACVHSSLFPNQRGRRSVQSASLSFLRTQAGRRKSMQYLLGVCIVRTQTLYVVSVLTLDGSADMREKGLCTIRWNQTTPQSRVNHWKIHHPTHVA